MSRPLRTTSSSTGVLSPQAAEQRVPMPSEEQSPDTLALSRSPNDPFVGRIREMTELHTILTEVWSGRGQVVFLAGEPGIGKTRLAQEFATTAQRRGAQVLWGRCWEGEGAPAFWPWVQIVRAYLQHGSPEILAAEMGSGAIDIAQVVGEVRERLPNLPVPPVVEPEHARFRFFDSLTAWLKKAAMRQPLLLILDDLHWADTPSLLLLRFLARELYDAPLLLLGTYRDTEVNPAHPLSDTLGALARESQRFILTGLAEEDIASLIQSTTGTMPTTNLITVVHQKTDGNPFFVSELVYLLQATGRLTAADGETLRQIRVPQGVRETIRQRVERLSPACIQLLEIATVIGREFSMDLLELVSKEHLGAARDQLLILLQEALSARLISEVSSEVGRYRFIHTLIRETLYEDLPVPGRLRLHRQIGEAVERRYGAYLRPHFAELADHFFQAAAGGDTDKAIYYARKAGERASVLLAYEEAANYYERALQLLPLTESHERQRCELLLALGEARSHAGEVQRARETFLQVAAIARKLMDRERTLQPASLLAQAALGFGKIWLVTGTGIVDEPLVHLLEEARRVLGETDSVLHARVLARLAAELRWAAPREQRATLSQQAVAMARRLGDESTLAYTLSAWHWAVWGADNVEERLAVTSEIVLLAEKSGDKVFALVGHTWRTIALLEMGEKEKAEANLEAVVRLADELRQPLYLWWSTGLQTMRALSTGRFIEAEQLAQQQLLIGQRVRAPDALQAFEVQMALLRNAQGRLQELEPAFKAFVEQYPTVPAWRCGLAGLYKELGDARRAREEFEQIAVHDFADLPQDQQWLTALVLLSEVCAFLEDDRHAALLYDILLPYSGRVVVIGTGTACYGAVSHSLGLLATVLFRWDDAERHFLEAVAMNERLQAQPFSVRTQYEYAQMLLTRNRYGDHIKAEELLEAAWTTAQQLGMISLQSKVQSLKSKLQEDEQQKVKQEKTERKIAIQTEDVPPSDARRQTLDARRSCIFRQEGEYWAIGYAGIVVRLGDAKGLHHIAALLREPGRAFHVVDLLAMAEAHRMAPASTATTRQKPTLQYRHSVRFPENRSLPDRQAKNAYQRRLADLQDELEEAERCNDLARASNVRAEIDFIRQEVAAAYGVGHHTHQMNTEIEKVRKTVTNRIRTALTKIQHVHPDLWRHLFTALKTGTFCSYNPERPVPWQM